jgi:hypothetical protein
VADGWVADLAEMLGNVFHRWRGCADGRNPAIRSANPDFGVAAAVRRVDPVRLGALFAHQIDASGEALAA